MTDSYNLQRFVDAQAPVFDQVLHELETGKKRSHWMWFVFPQIKGLGQSETAKHYGIASKDEARAYLRHPVLGPRLIKCCKTINALTGKTAEGVFGPIDAMKLRSSLTLFAAVSDDPIFQDCLDKYYNGKTDLRTLELL